MSYYAKMSGIIRLNSDKIKKEGIDDPIRFVEELNDKTIEIVLGINKVDYSIDIDAYESYSEDMWSQFLAEIAKITDDGEIKFSGEDDSHWRFVFRDGAFDEDIGSILYDGEGELTTGGVYAVSATWAYPNIVGLYPDEYRAERKYDECCAKNTDERIKYQLVFIPYGDDPKYRVIKESGVKAS